MQISKIFKNYILEYLNLYGTKIPENHLKAINDILSCRTSDLGGNTYYCENCDKIHYSYHSCKNRHCPKCGSQDSEKWLEKQTNKLLPVKYFMVTFTLPEELRSICRSNQKVFYSTLFKASASALRILLRDPQFVGGEAGFTGILHTWTRQIQYHPHVHFIVPGGAFDFERNCWNKGGHKFLIPVKALSKRFRKDFEDLLKMKAPELYNQIPSGIWKEKAFITNSIPVGKGEKAFTYLANYVYKTAITNNRIISCIDGNVTFTYKKSDTGKIKYKTIKVMEFIRRFLQHVLPFRFQKVRYFGFLSSASKKRWRTVSEYFNVKVEKPKEESKLLQPPKAVFCRHCNSEMVEHASVLRRPRAPPRKIISRILQKISKTD
jgi:hypothetical protein